ncbi:mannitol-1-phosphate 5-dehydrogenase [Microbacterium mangrovi]|uniref:mannitol-1-phosphate 5-dehydrogenase n=1 Tax=Microbacterium mangrovi TaxID=1348253 RepID=UPI00068CB545|nr:mannitol-1-phosphate 5-dehydrogenase [Microbacterium mangrovi]
MKAVHFGIGNIGRGLIGLVLHRGGYEITFCDVSSALVDAMNAAGSYTVHEAGVGGAVSVVTGFRALDSGMDPDTVAAEIATADVVTTAVGPTVLSRIAPLVVAGLRRRDPARPPLQVMACENAIGATDLLKSEIARLAGGDATTFRAVFANTAIDRLVPTQPSRDGVDVTVEPFFEWAVERAPFGDDPPVLPGAHLVDDLAPFIQRKLYTVNTGHATAAYLGFRAGFETVPEALADPQIARVVATAMEETSAVLARRHGLDAVELAEYRTTALRRLADPAIPADTVARVGRQPMRKLSRHERFIGPAALAAEWGLPVEALLTGIGAALAFDVPADAQAVELRALLQTRDAGELTSILTGLDGSHPLFAAVRALIVDRQASSVRGRMPSRAIRA